MTVPEHLVEKAALALHASYQRDCCPDDPRLPCPVPDLSDEIEDVRTAIAAVYGDIVEAARRDALDQAAKAIRAMSPTGNVTPGPYWLGWDNGRGQAADVVAALDENGPSDRLSATESVQGAVPRIPGTDGAQEATQPLVPAWVTGTMDDHAVAAAERMAKVQGLMHDGRVVTYEIAPDDEGRDDV